MAFVLRAPCQLCLEAWRLRSFASWIHPAHCPGPRISNQMRTAFDLDSSNLHRETRLLLLGAQPRWSLLYQGIYYRSSPVIIYSPLYRSGLVVEQSLPLDVLPQLCRVTG